MAEETPEQAGSSGFCEAGKGTFCSRKRPSMMLLHRSSSRLRSTMWSRTSSPGLAAERPRGSHWLMSPHPPGPASDNHPTVYTPYMGLWAWSPVPPTRSPQYAVCAPSGSRAAAAAGGAAQACALPWNCNVGDLGQGRPVTSPATPPSLPPPHSPLGLASVHAQ